MLEESELEDVDVSIRGASRLMPSHGYVPLGITALRSAIADRFTAQGVPTIADQILVTSGGQSAISLIAATLLTPNDRVVTESPTYPAAIEVFIRAGARVEGVERDHAGPTVEAIGRALGSGSVRMIYVIPTCHNPTGGIMSEGRRRSLLRLARDARALVIEDGTLEDLALASVPPSLAAIDPDRVISVGSLSKSVWGGLRVGWIRAPAETILRVGRVRASWELGSPSLGQAAALQILQRYDDVLERRRELYRERLGVLCGELQAHLPDWSFEQPRGGLCVWAKLPYGNADYLAQLALRRGVAIAPGRTASPGEEFLAHLRLGAGPSPALIREGVARLACAWEELENLESPCQQQRVLIDPVAGHLATSR